MFLPLCISELYVIHSLPPHVKDILLLLSLASELSVFKFLLYIMMLHLPHLTYNKMYIYIYIYIYIITFNTLCSSPKMHLKRVFLILFSLTLYIVVPIYNLFDMLALHANTAHFESYISATFCTLTFSTTCPSCPFSDFLFASSNEVSTILLVTSVKC